MVPADQRDGTIQYTLGSDPGLRVFTPRELNWQMPSSTRHVEYTVTDKCYLIEAETPCSGCTLVNKQGAEEGVIVDLGVPREDEGRLRMNVDFVTAVAQREVDRGINLITYMGGEPLTIRDFDKVIRWTREHPVLSGLTYSSSAYYFRPDGKPSRKLEEHENAGLFSPEFGYFKSSVDMLITDPSQLPPVHDPLRGDAFKSFYGLKLAEFLAARGHEVAIHQTLKDYTLVYTRPLYQWAKDRGVRFSACPTVWLPYVSNGTPEAFYNHRLRPEYEGQLQEIIDYIVDDTTHRFQLNKKRIWVPSSAFTRLMPKFGPTNTINCKDDRKGLQPNGQDIHPDGQLRWCIAQNNSADGLNCGGCFYIGIDRDGDYWNFEHLAGLSSGDVRWLNADVWKKDPEYDPTGANLFFDAQGNSLP